MSKRAIIIHGWDGSPNDCWIPSLGKSLRELGFEVFIPKMPNPAKPRLNKWLDTIKEAIGKPDKDTFFIGHSTGCITALQYISSQSTGSQVGGCIFVAGFIESIGIQEIEEFVEKPLDLEKIKSICPKITMFNSDNDEVVPLDTAKRMAKKLDAKLVIEKEKGHFDEDDKVFELPTALEAVKEMIK